jgi:hypothetical protein
MGQVRPLAICIFSFENIYTHNGIPGHEVVLVYDGDKSLLYPDGLLEMLLYKPRQRGCCRERINKT